MDRKMSKVRLFSESRIVVIVTGGMVMQEFDEETGCCVPNKNSKEIIESIGAEVNLEKLDIVEFSVIDSSAIDLDFLHNLSKVVQRKINNENVDGIAIIVGNP
jgi:L-asparaginase/Glu-tRNA(Gln) amidotransferase subunit D